MGCVAHLVSDDVFVDASTKRSCVCGFLCMSCRAFGSEREQTIYKNWLRRLVNWLQLLRRLRNSVSMPAADRISSVHMYDAELINVTSYSGVTAQIRSNLDRKIRCGADQRQLHPIECMCTSGHCLDVYHKRHRRGFCRCRSNCKPMSESREPRQVRRVVFARYRVSSPYASHHAAHTPTLPFPEVHH
jgi:hypothetical protein